MFIADTSGSILCVIKHIPRDIFDCSWTMSQHSFTKLLKLFGMIMGQSFFNSNVWQFFDDQGINHQSNCVGTPQQNGRAERKHRDLLNTACTLKFQGVIPTTYWGCCVLETCYLINFLPSSIISGKAPFELLFGKPPNLSHLRILGCLSFTTNLGVTYKFAERVVHVVMMGYSMT